MSRILGYHKNVLSSYNEGGKTLQEVGDEFLITRERVRQILLMFGVRSDFRPGAERRRAIRKQRVMEVRRLKTLIPRMELGLYYQQRKSASRRRIKWEISFADWMDCWIVSGHWDNRGRRKGQFVMARYGDQGPYKIGNVYIITTSQNVHDMRVRLRGSGGLCALGRGGGAGQAAG